MKQNFLTDAFRKIENFVAISAVRNGLINTIPVLLIGSFSLLFQTLPLPFYQEFIKSVFGGNVYAVLQMIYNATFGMLSVYMTLSVANAYGEVSLHGRAPLFGAIFASVINYAVFIGFLSHESYTSFLGVKGMFSGLFASIVSVNLYRLFCKLLPAQKLYADTSDAGFNSMLGTLAPIALTILCGAGFNLAITKIFGVANFQALFTGGVHALFSHLGKSPLAAVLFVFLSSLLWFFGIHGNDVFEDVVQQFFAPGLAQNQAQLVPTELFTKEFFDVFVFMGGCGTTFSLLIAIILFSKHKNNKRLTKLSLFPMVFNINEMMVFGLPIVLNPVFLLPFLLTPLVCVFTTMTAMQLGLVPFTIHSVEWTTPIVLGGYTATGSAAGSVLQLFNLAAGVLIYWPFVRLYDRQLYALSKARLNDLIHHLQDAQDHNLPITLTHEPGVLGTVAKSLAMDFTRALENDELTLYYQPQFDKDRRWVGAEALLRWQHPYWGMIYPPLVVKLAEEMGLLTEFDQWVLTRAAWDQKRLPQTDGFSLSANITSKTLQDENFVAFMKNLTEKSGIQNQRFCLEVTEQIALRIDLSLQERLIKLREMGILLAVDDFSMGATSLKYLQSEQFDIVKIDGNLVKGLDLAASNQNIIDSIVYLSKSLGFRVIAEYVETESQRELLEEIGCYLYQGYLYAPAMPLDELLNKFGE